MKGELIVGSRGSALAMAQTEGVVSALHSAYRELRVRVETITTFADADPDQPFDRLGSVGFFVKEIEVALAEGRIDAAVHSMKDLPTEASPQLVIAATPPREDPRDVLVARGGFTLETLPPAARIGTSSPRRAAYLRAMRPDLTIAPVRGNVETRIRKMDEGLLDAVCLAAAGLVRLGLADRVSQWLPVRQMLPAPGQGALGVQVRADDSQTLERVRVLDHTPTKEAVTAERAVLRRMQGGCRLPVGAFADIEGGRLRLTAAVIASDGSRVIGGAREGATHDGAALGADLAEELLARGAAGLL
ncbi:MAG: hydroxymethylbilane synthase [bacterium]